MVKNANKSLVWNSDKCVMSPKTYCFDHKRFLWDPWTKSKHSECKVEQVKTHEEASELMSLLKLLVNRLRSIWEWEFAEKMIKDHVDAMKPFFFEFNIYLSSFRKAQKEHNYKPQNWTVLFHRFQSFHKALKENKAYLKVIEFDFEQRLCQDLEQENTKSSCCSSETKETMEQTPTKSPEIFEKAKQLDFVEEELPLNRVIRIRRVVPKRRVSMVPMYNNHLFGESTKNSRIDRNSETSCLVDKWNFGVKNALAIYELPRRIRNTPLNSKKPIEE